MNEINLLKKNKLLKTLAEGCKIHPGLERGGKQQTDVQIVY